MLLSLDPKDIVGLERYASTYDTTRYVNQVCGVVL